MNPVHSIPRLTLRLTTAAVLLAIPAMLYAQEDRPEEDEQQVEEQMLEDFGSGLRALGALLDDPVIEDDMKELWQIADEAVRPAEDQDFESSQQQEELEGFREELKSSVMDGSMSRNEARMTWLEIMDVRFFHDFNKDQAAEWANRLEESAGMGHLSSIFLRIPNAGDVRVLTRPEFLQRDLQYLSRELELNEENRSIIKVLIENYVSAYEQRSAPLHEAIGSLREGMARQSSRDRIAKALTNLNNLVESIDLVQVRNQIGQQFVEGDRKEWFYNAINRFEGSVTNVQKAIERRHGDLDQTVGTGPDTTQILEMAANLQADRRRLRAQLIESINLALGEQQQQKLESIFNAFILGQARIDSKLGGSRINLQSALEKAFEDRSVDEGLQAIISESTMQLLQLIERWTNARIERERSGLELFIAYQRDDDSSVEGLTRKHAQRAKTELNAALAIRDRLIAVQVELETVMAEFDRETATRFANIARQQGFAPQMRTRWSERAISSALACTNLDQERLDTLDEYQSSVTSQLEPLRMHAIQERLMIEPKIARTKIDRITGKKNNRPTLGLAGWQEPGIARFQSIDEEVDARLHSLLEGMPCVETLPRRRGTMPVATR